jgi:hypothetical protein
MLFLAWTRLSPAAVCEMSRGREPNADFHDYKDGTIKDPMHFYTYTCERCGKAFTI